MKTLHRPRKSADGTGYAEGRKNGRARAADRKTICGNRAPDNPGYLVEKNLASSLSRVERIGLLEKDNIKMPLQEQCDLLTLNRTSLYYYHPVEPSAEEVAIKRRMDAIYREWLFCN